MKKDIFTIWLKEFCSLVFTQAVQAFLLAAVMSVVIATASGNIASNRGAAVSATGIIAIIALSAISKIEALVKKIFGIESQFGDPSMKSGMAGLAGTLIGAKLAGRVLNNVGKVGSGAIDLGKQARDRARLKRNYARDLGRLGVPPAAEPSAAASSGGNGAIAAGVGAGAAAGAAAGAGIAAAASGGNGGLVQAPLAGSVAQASTGGTVTLSPNAVTVNGSNVSVDGKQSSSDKLAAFNEKKAEILEKYEDALEKLNDQRAAGRAKVAAGIAESVGGVAGGIAGATVGLATGDGILTKTGAGMGMGDYVGEKTVQTVKTSYDIKVTSDRKDKEERKATKAISELTGKDISNYRSAIKDLEKYASRLGDITNEAANKTDAGNI